MLAFLDYCKYNPLITMNRFDAYTVSCDKVVKYSYDPLREKTKRLVVKKRSKVTGVSKYSRRRFFQHFDALGSYLQCYNRPMVSVTLTYPSVKKGVNLFELAKKHITRFCKRLTYRNIMYMWVLEVQRNGNPHYHFIIDTFMSVENVRALWHETIKDTGLLQAYSAKFSKMDYPEYRSYRISHDIDKHHDNEIYYAYRRGVASLWSCPNTTDVRRIGNHDRKKLWRYLAKYMSKTDYDTRVVGRMWGCSHSLSKIVKFRIYPYPESELQGKLFGEFSAWGNKTMFCHEDFLSGKVDKVYAVISKAEDGFLAYPFRNYYSRCRELVLRHYPAVQRWKYDFVDANYCSVTDSAQDIDTIYNYLCGYLVNWENIKVLPQEVVRNSLGESSIFSWQTRKACEINSYVDFVPIDDTRAQIDIPYDG